MMFSVTTNFYGEMTYNFGAGLAILISGPIVLRFTYEMLMLRILGVRNLMDINNKMEKLLEEKERTYESVEHIVMPDKEEKKEKED